jgi:iron-sulfur cluster assembly accessory protein
MDITQVTPQAKTDRPETAYQVTGVTFTDLGATKVRELLSKAKEANPSSADLRVDVIPGGCSGFHYRLAFDHAHDGDAVFEDRGLWILIDRRSLPLIDGSTIDWAKGSPGLKIENPNVVSSCGCGSSFHVAEDQPRPTV